DDLVQLQRGANRSHLDAGGGNGPGAGGGGFARLAAPGALEGSDGGVHAIPWVRYHATVFSRPGSSRYSARKPISWVARAGEQVQASWAISFALSRFMIETFPSRRLPSSAPAPVAQPTTSGTETTFGFPRRSARLRAMKKSSQL